MRFFVAGLASVAIGLCGCGGGDDEAAVGAPSSTPTADAKSQPANRCPAGTKLVTAEQLIPDPASGYSLVPSDPQATKTIVNTLRSALGGRWRDHDENVLVRDGAASGALLLVINHTERTNGAGELVAGMTDSGRPGEPITVRGQTTKLVRTIDGAYVTAAVAGDCAVVLLFADSEKVARNAVRQLGAS
jgi:hypothetical protein